MEWLYPYRKKDYDLDSAIHSLRRIDWNRSNYTFKPLDIVYFYSCAPERCIKYKCLIVKADKNVSTYNDEPFGGSMPGVKGKFFEAALMYEFKNPITLDQLKEYGVTDSHFTVTKVSSKPGLLEFLNKYEEEDRQNDSVIQTLTEEDVEEIEQDIPLPPGEERDAVVKQRVNQSSFRERLLEMHECCQLCGVTNPSLLIASHIKPWSKSTGSEKTSVYNGLLLCPAHDKLFDTGLISFDEDGKILISDELSEEDRELLNVNEEQTIEMPAETIPFMLYHREKIFKR